MRTCRRTFIHKRIYTYNTHIRALYIRIRTFFTHISVQTHAGLLTAGALHFIMHTITWEKGKLKEKGKGKATSAKRRVFYLRCGLNSVCFCYFATSNDSGVGVFQLPSVFVCECSTKILAFIDVKLFL